MKAGPLAGLTVEVKYFDGCANGVRRVDAVGSQIIVDAGPVEEFATIARTAELRDRTVAYVLLRGEKQGYVGKGSCGSRLPHQTGKSGSGSKFAARQVFVLHARDPRSDKTASCYVEAQLIERGFAVGAPLTNGVAAFEGDIGGGHLVDYPGMAEEARLFLAAAGCSIFEDFNSREDEADPPLRDGYRIIPAHGFTPPIGAQLLRLDRSNFVCEGYRLGNHLIVRPGSHFKIKTGNGGLRSANVRRRAAILGRDILDPDPECSDRKLLTTWIEFKDPEVAARVLSGVHSTVTSWVPVERAADGVDQVETSTHNEKIVAGRAA